MRSINRSALFIFPVICLTVIMACLKEPKFDEGNGSPVTLADMQTKLSDGWGNFDPLEIRKNEFNFQEKTIQLSTLFPQLNLQKGTTVTGIVSLPTQNELHIVIQANEILDNSQSKPSTRERVAYVNKPSSSPTPTPTSALPAAMVTQKLEKNFPVLFAKLTSQNSALQFHQSVLKNLAQLPLSPLDPAQKSGVNTTADEGEISQLGVELYYNLLGICAPPSQAMIDQGLINIECFNLTSEKVLEPLPELVRKQAGCQGFANCQYHVTNVQFDVVYTNYEASTRVTTKTKVIYTVKLSSEVPFFSKLLDFCYQGMAASGNQRFPVTICTKTQNFMFGSL